MCEKLNILQKDFFGLKLKDDKNGARWLNLRNALSLEVNCSYTVKLSFSIKYFVQPHHLLQDSTRFVDESAIVLHISIKSTSCYCFVAGMLFLKSQGIIFCQSNSTPLEKTLSTMLQAFFITVRIQKRLPLAASFRPVASPNRDLSK